MIRMVKGWARSQVRSICNTYGEGGWARPQVRSIYNTYGGGLG